MVYSCTHMATVGVRELRVASERRQRRNATIGYNCSAVYCRLASPVVEY